MGWLRPLFNPKSVAKAQALRAGRSSMLHSGALLLAATSKEGTGTGRAAISPNRFKFQDHW